MRRERDYWRSLEDREGRPALGELVHRELPEGATELELDLRSELSRRRFLSLSCASAALAGAGLSGCIRKPKEPVLPYAQRPEELIPGVPRRFATAAMVGGGVQGLLVESQDGRPTKIEGLPLHPMNGGTLPLANGAASAWAQAEVLGLYDPDRSRAPRLDGKETTLDAFQDWARDRLSALRRVRGKGLALLLDWRLSPSYRRLLDELVLELPEARLYLHDAVYPANARAGAALCGAPGRHLLLAPDRADVILALDADPLGLEGDATRHARLFASRRDVLSPAAQMNRLYVVEPAFTLTGAAADHRLRLRSSEVEGFLEALLAALIAPPHALSLPRSAEEILAALSPAAAARSRWGKWIPALAADLARSRGRSLVVVGERQPPRVHALGLLLSTMLELQGRSFWFVEDRETPRAGTISELARELSGGRVQTLLCLGGNPVYDAPAELELGKLFASVPERLHLSSHHDETSRACRWHLPRSHFLETWGDHRAADGTVSIQQPLCAPLHSSLSELELLARLLGRPSPRGYELVRETWARRLTPATQPASRPAHADPGFEARWRRWLHDGIVELGIGSPTSLPTEPAPELRFEALARTRAARPAAASRESLEVVFQLDPSVCDGRYANNGWLQELPDPVTKLTWDNAVVLSPATAGELGIKSHELLELSLGGRSLRGPALIVPGTVDHALILALGYGRKHGGAVAAGAGFDAGAIRTSQARWFASGAAARRAGGRGVLAMTQEHWYLEGRPLIREQTIGEFRTHPAKTAEVHGPPLRNLWQDPVVYKGRQWGMVIDLNLCNGCGACAIACQAENNIPVVGKRRVIENREMAWIRVDRYFTGPAADPQVRYQPVPCMQCESAPCEQVCPVAATAHSPDGLNDQAYNRCIGTRYCSNNCPYKVRRFNFFQYNKDTDPLLRMQKNPDVTLRFRGVMEKCTYCVQRIQEAKIQAKVSGKGGEAEDHWPDGTVVPACMQTCPTGAIVFGDINDDGSVVFKRRKQPRHYALLAELNVRPRTTYLAKLKNPNPELG
jgi:molybdopterin-containing oxidoreductase family iron-sulfur binding subunit